MGIVAPDTRAPLTTVNIDLYCGLAMMAFGGAMLTLAWRASRRS
jgi:hypothetical protein